MASLLSFCSLAEQLNCFHDRQSADPSAMARGKKSKQLMVNWKCFSHYTELQNIPGCPSQEQTVVLVRLGHYNIYQRGNVV